MRNMLYFLLSEGREERDSSESIYYSRGARAYNIQSSSLLTMVIAILCVWYV